MFTAGAAICVAPFNPNGSTFCNMRLFPEELDVVDYLVKHTHHLNLKSGKPPDIRYLKGPRLRESQLLRPNQTADPPFALNGVASGLSRSRDPRNTPNVPGA